MYLNLNLNLAPNLNLNLNLALNLNLNLNPTGIRFPRLPRKDPRNDLWWEWLFRVSRAC